MFVSASSRCFADLSFPDACQSLVDHGYDRIELWFSTTMPHLNPIDIGANPERFVAEYREHTRLTPVAFDLHHDIPDSAFDGICRLAKLMKVTQISLNASPLGSPFNEEVDRLRRRVGATSSSGIRLSLRTEIGTLTEDPRTAVELCQSITGLGITFDPSHLMCGPHANQPIEPVFPYVYHTHLRDSLPKDLQVPVGLGEVDYNRIVNLLRRQNYTRALSVEILHDRLNGADRLLELRKIRMLLETLL